jgi:hypothetical protein
MTTKTLQNITVSLQILLIAEHSELFELFLQTENILTIHKVQKLREYSDNLPAP